MELFIYQDEDSTSARAILHADSPEHKEAYGRAIKAPDDQAVPEIGDEVAAAQALHNRADVPLTTAAEDISEIENRSVQLDFPCRTRVTASVSARVTKTD